VPQPVLPDKVTLVSPSGTISTNTPAYNWKADAHATWYLLYVSDTSGNPINTWYSASTAGCPDGNGACSVTPDILVGGAAKWWVRGWNPNGYGPWGDGMAFDAPIPTAPGKATLVSPTGTISTNTPAFTWNAVADCTWYWLWASDSSGNKINHWYSATQAGCSGGIGICSVAPGTALATGLGNWWIRTWNSVGYGPWSTGMSFTVSASSELKE
jgi:hypothetical protein